MVRRCGLVVAMLAVALMLTGVSSAQDNEKKTSADAARAEKSAWSFYKLELVVREMDGTKVINTRNYTLTQRVGDWGQLRVGSRLPISDANHQLQYFDVGLNLDSRVQERDDVLAFDWRMELSSVAPEAGANGNPIIRNVKSNGQAMLAQGKPVTMTSVDDLNSTHKFVFEVTATRVK